tara:strand:- start:154 stop:303 length:150 start_codon:yes stop_codon:yes gene_type:complete
MFAEFCENEFEFIFFRDVAAPAEKNSYFSAREKSPVGITTFLSDAKALE